MRRIDRPLFAFSTKAYSDTYFANVSLLLHCDGIDGSTAFLDSSIRPKTISTAVDASIRTAQSKFGGASGLIATAANLSWISAPNDVDFDLSTGDFTIEAWIYPTSIGQSLIVQKAIGTGNYPWQLYLDATGHLGFRCINSGGGLSINVLSSGTVPVNAWTFVQASRSANDFACAMNGVQIGTANAGAITLWSDTAPVYIGGYSTVAYPLIGYVDEVRITKGVARPFGLPTSAFPGA